MKTSGPLLALAKTEVFHELSWGVSEPNGDRLVTGLFGEIDGGIPSVGGGARFGTLRESDGDVGEDEARLGHAATFDGFETSGGEVQSATCGESDVFGGKNHHAAGDELGVFASVDHASKIVESGIDVGAAHRLDKSGNIVVVVVARFVVARELLASGFDDGGFGDVRAERHGKF